MSAASDVRRVHPPRRSSVLRLGGFAFVALVPLFASALGCSRAESTNQGASPDPGANAAAPPSSAEPKSGPLVLAQGVRLIKAPSGDVAELVRNERTKAIADGRELIVYVGAKWCEPCQRFHQAAEAGKLDADFPALSFLEFDLDEDRERIVAAGYTSKLIPLFVVPGEDGRASARRFEGGVKGERAVSVISSRLRALLAR